MMQLISENEWTQCAESESPIKFPSIGTVLVWAISIMIIHYSIVATLAYISRGNLKRTRRRANIDFGRLWG